MSRDSTAGGRQVIKGIDMGAVPLADGLPSAMRLSNLVEALVVGGGEAASGEDGVAFGRFSMDLRGEDLEREPGVPSVDVGQCRTRLG